MATQAQRRAGGAGDGGEDLSHDPAAKHLAPLQPPEDCSIRAYALDEIVVEKIVALTDRARNEPRDLYDIWYLTSEGHVDLDMLVPEIDSKLEFRKRTRDGFADELARKEKRYKKLWAARLGAQMADLPSFDQVYRAVSRAMRAAGLMD